VVTSISIRQSRSVQHIDGRRALSNTEPALRRDGARNEWGNSRKVSADVPRYEGERRCPTIRISENQGSGAVVHVLSFHGSLSRSVHATDSIGASSSEFEVIWRLGGRCAMHVLMFFHGWRCENVQDGDVSNVDPKLSVGLPFNRGIQRSVHHSIDRTPCPSACRSATAQMVLSNGRA
jgi:hypothetical protein